MDSLLETWRINDRINRYLLDAIPPDALNIKLAKGKSVGGNLTHVHNVRLMWLKSAAPDLLESQTKFEQEPFDSDEIGRRLTASGLAIEEMVRRAGSPEGRIKGFKPHAAAFVGYLIAHESFHRAMVEIGLRQAEVPLSDKVAYGMWEWGSR